MNIYPAIDIMEGKAVRLYRGEKKKVTIYGDPVKIASEYAKFTDRLHIVDLDGAFNGVPVNFGTVERIIVETGMKVQIGGGFRNYESIKQAYDTGVTNVIVGTRAFDFGFLEKITNDFKGVTVSLDLKNNDLMISGWTKKENADLKNIFKSLEEYADRFVYTNIEKDGTLEGISFIEKFWEESEMIYAAGVNSMDDVRKLGEMGFSGVIIGKALLEGKIKIRELTGVQ